MATTPKEHCRDCGSEDLFSGWFDAEDLGFSLDIDTPRHLVPDGVRWTTFCNQCGAEQIAKKERRR